MCKGPSPLRKILHGTENFPDNTCAVNKTSFFQQNILERLKIFNFFLFSWENKQDSQSKLEKIVKMVEQAVTKRSKMENAMENNISAREDETVLKNRLFLQHLRVRASTPAITIVPFPHIRVRFPQNMVQSKSLLDRPMSSATLPVPVNTPRLNMSSNFNLNVVDDDAENENGDDHGGMRPPSYMIHLSVPVVHHCIHYW